MHYFAFINKELHLPVKCRLPTSFVTAQPLQQLLLLLTEASGTRTRSKKNKKKKELTAHSSDCGVAAAGMWLLSLLQCGSGEGAGRALGEQTEQRGHL